MHPNVIGEDKAHISQHEKDTSTHTQATPARNLVLPTMSKPIDYSRWDNHDVSDDEDDCNKKPRAKIEIGVPQKTGSCPHGGPPFGPERDRRLAILLETARDLDNVRMQNLSASVSDISKNSYDDETQYSRSSFSVYLVGRCCRLHFAWRFR